MLLVPWEVGLAVLLQPEVERNTIDAIEALVRVHIGFQAVPYCWLHEGHEGHSICTLALHVTKPKTSIPTKSNDNRANSCVSTRFDI